MTATGPDGWKPTPVRGGEPTELPCLSPLSPTRLGVGAYYDSDRRCAVTVRVGPLAEDRTDVRLSSKKPSVVAARVARPSQRLPLHPIHAAELFICALLRSSPDSHYPGADT